MKNNSRSSMHEILNFRSTLNFRSPLRFYKPLHSLNPGNFLIHKTQISTISPVHLTHIPTQPTQVSKFVDLDTFYFFKCCINKDRFKVHFIFPTYTTKLHEIIIIANVHTGKLVLLKQLSHFSLL